MDCDKLKCESCPVRGMAIGCHGHAAHPRYCDLARTRPEDYRGIIVETSKRMDHPCDKLLTVLQPEARVAAVTGHDAPPQVDIPTRFFRDRELVVARYREDVSWLKGVPMRVVLYNKGDDLDDLPDHVEHVRRPNVGREAEVMLNHIVSRYDTLAPLTFFCQGDPFDHSPDFLARLVHPYTEPTSLTTMYLPNCPDRWIKDRDRVEEVFGHEVRYGDGAINAHGDQSSERAWFNPAAWSFVFRCPRPVPQWFGYAATWAVPSRCITRRRRDAWKWLLDNLDSGASGDSWAGPVNPWSMEAMWYYLWSDPREYPLVEEAWTPRVAAPTRSARPCNCGKNKPSARIRK